MCIVANTQIACCSFSGKSWKTWPLRKDVLRGFVSSEKELATVETILNQILLRGSAPKKFPWRHCVSAVRDTLECLPVASITSRRQLKLLYQSVNSGSFAIQLVRTDGDRLPKAMLQELQEGDEPLLEALHAFVVPVAKVESGSAGFLPLAQQVKQTVHRGPYGAGWTQFGRTSAIWHLRSYW